jgi:hypothetical protein
MQFAHNTHRRKAIERVVEAVEKGVNSAKLVPLMANLWKFEEGLCHDLLRTSALYPSDSTREERQRLVEFHLYLEGKLKHALALLPMMAVLDYSENDEFRKNIKLLELVQLLHSVDQYLSGKISVQGSFHHDNEDTSEAAVAALFLPVDVSARTLENPNLLYWIKNFNDPQMWTIYDLLGFRDVCLEVSQAFQTRSRARYDPSTLLVLLHRVADVGQSRKQLDDEFDKIRQPANWWRLNPQPPLPPWKPETLRYLKKAQNLHMALVREIAYRLCVDRIGDAMDFCDIWEHKGTLRAALNNPQLSARNKLVAWTLHFQAVVKSVLESPLGFTAYGKERIPQLLEHMQKMPSTETMGLIEVFIKVCAVVFAPLTCVDCVLT